MVRERMQMMQRIEFLNLFGLKSVGHGNLQHDMTALRRDGPAKRRAASVRRVSDAGAEAEQFTLGVRTSGKERAGKAAAAHGDASLAVLIGDRRIASQAHLPYG
jgi:hypothetical protein